MGFINLLNVTSVIEKSIQILKSSTESLMMLGSFFGIFFKIKLKKRTGLDKKFDLSVKLSGYNIDSWNGSLSYLKKSDSLQRRQRKQAHSLQNH